MKVHGSYKLSAAPDRAYAILQDPEVLARCMPGCDELVRIGEDEYRMKMKMALASISGLFDGTVRIADSNPPSSFRLVVEGKGKIGFVRGDGLLHLTPDGDGTEVGYDGEVHVGGTIAAVGQRLLDTTARMMIKKFFDKLSESVRENG
jgi:carbon monoxide dehydrogenase subunit G